jgi:hypothetical protein
MHLEQRNNLKGMIMINSYREFLLKRLSLIFDEAEQISEELNLLDSYNIFQTQLFNNEINNCPPSIEKQDGLSG